MFKESTLWSSVGNESTKKATTPVSKTSNSRVLAGVNGKRDEMPKDAWKHSNLQLLAGKVSESGLHVDHTNRKSPAANVITGSKKVQAFCGSVANANDLSKAHKQLSKTGRELPIMQTSEREAVPLQSKSEMPKMLPIFREDAVDIFNSLGLSEKQIIGLERFGFGVSKLLPQHSREMIRRCKNYNKAPMPCTSGKGKPEQLPIPYFFQLPCATCYVCKSRQQVVYGIGLIFQKNPSVIAVELERGPTPSIQIGTSNIVLVVPLNKAARALRILFRDPQVIKIGMNIREKLKFMWLELQIESMLFLELSDLLQLSNDGVVGKFDLQKMAVALGYSEQGSGGLKGRLHQAVVSVQIINKVFWGMVKRHGMKDGRMDLTLINPLCTHVPISMILNEEQKRMKQRPCVLDPRGEIMTPRMSISSGEEDPEDSEML